MDNNFEFYLAGSGPSLKIDDKGISARRKEFGIVSFPAKKIVKKKWIKTFDLLRSNVLIWRGENINFGVDGSGKNYIYIQKYKRFFLFKKRLCQSDRMATINYLEKSKNNLKFCFGICQNPVFINLDDDLLRLRN